MRLRDLWRRWDAFLFRPVSTFNICVLRIIWGCILCASILMMLPDRHMWFGIDGVLGSMTQETPGRLNIMPFLTTTPGSVDIWFATLLAVSAAATIGFFTRTSLLIIWVMLTSMTHTNILILHAGDTLLRFTGFFLIFSPAGTCLSIDAWRRGESQLYAPLRSPWAQRILQIQLCIVYIATSWWKLKGMPWNDGTAVGQVLNMLEFRRFPLPEFFRGVTMSQALTGYAATVEMLFPILVWFKDTRKPALIAGLLLHLGMEWSLNIQLFQPTILSLYLLFISPEALRRFLNFLTESCRLLRRRCNRTHQHRP